MGVQAGSGYEEILGSGWWLDLGLLGGSYAMLGYRYK
jgi:hypothetical protein